MLDVHHDYVDKFVQSLLDGVGLDLEREGSLEASSLDALFSCHFRTIHVTVEVVIMVEMGRDTLIEKY